MNKLADQAVQAIYKALGSMCTGIDGVARLPASEAWPHLHHNFFAIANALDEVVGDPLYVVQHVLVLASLLVALWAVHQAVQGSTR